MTGAPDVIVVNYRSADDTVRALRSLEWAQLGTVHVVDNSVDPGEAGHLKLACGHWPQARLHVTAENLGFGQACNLAWDLSDSPEVLLLNPDARLRVGALARLRQTLAEQPRLAAVAPRIDWTEEGRLVLPNLSSQSPAARIADVACSRWAPMSTRAFAARGARHARRTMRQMASISPCRVSALSGAVLLLRRRAVQQLGRLFDPAYFMFFEDTDLSHRLRRRGWQLGVEPRARAWHAWHNRPEKAALMAQSERIYLQRHHPLGDRVQRWLVPRLAADAWRGDRRAVPLFRDAESVRSEIGRFWAITPLPTLHPAGVRADGVAYALSDEEWSLLDPGRWYVWVDQPGASTWRRFDVGHGD